MSLKIPGRRCTWCKKKIWKVSTGLYKACRPLHKKCLLRLAGLEIGDIMKMATFISNGEPKGWKEVEIIDIVDFKHCGVPWNFKVRSLTGERLVFNNIEFRPINQLLFVRKGNENE